MEPDIRTQPHRIYRARCRVEMCGTLGETCKVCNSLQKGRVAASSAQGHQIIPGTLVADRAESGLALRMVEPGWLLRTRLCIKLGPMAGICCGHVHDLGTYYGTFTPNYIRQRNNLPNRRDEPQIFVTIQATIEIFFFWLVSFFLLPLWFFAYPLLIFF